MCSEQLTAVMATRRRTKTEPATASSANGGEDSSDDNAIETKAEDVKVKPSTSINCPDPDAIVPTTVKSSSAAVAPAPFDSEDIAIKVSVHYNGHNGWGRNRAPPLEKI